ncbi:alcohol-forming fatty acyl-CoA reductase-like isoform X1 [Tasmannia lanceolata]|uniref:alcohol-forming fatty acyl-CoA reductase-like isoform X1 n=1 Tax=Tasmannia lanceolata TaxID=3420 RepID=UPI004062AA0F
MDFQMDLGCILQSLENKSILVTGSTGFLAKIFVEKLLRVQPHVKRLFLLIRPTKDETAKDRLQNGVMEKEVFRVLREKYGKGFYSFVWDKVTPLAGDIAYENLGIEENSLKEEMWREINVVVNVAATTNFDERYDVSLVTNTMGAKHVLEFAKKCVKLEMLLHISTAYVAGEKAGLILEKPFNMGETLNGSMGLDIEAEMKLAKERLIELRDDGAERKAETIAMKELGIQRARFFGWPNTYVFTKAMGEMLLGRFRENIPLVIIRPTIITSTYREPFPGWIEGIRTIDSFIVSYGKGRLRCIPAAHREILDVIPGDMVVNAMIVNMAAHSRQPSIFIYHIGSSVQNPYSIPKLLDKMYHYFSKNPCITDDGRPIRVSRTTIFNAMDTFWLYMTLRYMLPLKGLGLANAVFCKHFDHLYNGLRRRYNFTMRLIHLYKPYLFFKGRFDDLNSEKLRMAMKDNGVVDEMFCFDPKCIDWEEYFMKIHIPGVVKHLFK